VPPWCTEQIVQFCPSYLWPASWFLVFLELLMATAPLRGIHIIIKDSNRIWKLFTFLFIFKMDVLLLLRARYDGIWQHGFPIQNGEG